MISKCVGCRLANTTINKSSELMYSFPVDSPMSVLHIDGYTVGADVNFVGDRIFLIAVCGMCTFAVGEPVSKLSSTTFAQALMSIMLRFGFAHTVVLDKDSKFLSVFKEMCQLLTLNTHTISAGNHGAMLVEHVNEYLNRGLKIFKGERGTPAISREAVLMLLYAWNACPVPLTDITRSMIVTGREFAFPIDFSHEKAVELTGSKQ